ncbi:Rid family hydrolase [uncultured Campylobacter sp.]|uniref:Rid family hydrolase n=1 Tax=uncultured Campylobacter sp. TaxID=218934 RepID=UPI00262B69FC|nr:Rid family hydrolase [uncultured Campylobacter sp.]
MKEIYPSGFAPKKAHYAPGILDDDGMLYVSGQLSVDPRTGAVPEGLAAQAAQALSNVAAVLAAAGADKNDVRMCRVYTPDVANCGM